MTPTPQLRLKSRPPSRPDHTPLHVDTDRSQLWELVEDTSVHLILREPALLELARRKDTKLYEYCESLLTSGDIDDWFLGVKALAELGTRPAVDRLVMAYAGSLSDDRRFITSLLAQSLSADYVRPFSIMVRELAVPGEIDVTGWTSTAIATLQDVCKRLGIRSIVDKSVQGKHTLPVVMEDDMLDNEGLVSEQLYE
jgi:hypothetical protein